MSTTPKVSVIIPVYNAEEYLKQCIESIVGQTLREIEIICVDDGSTDRSVAILQEIQGRDQRLQIFQQKNSGAGIARNLAMRAAQGEYIAFMDSDDYYPSDDVLERLVDVAQNNHAMICGGSLLFDKSGKLEKAELQGINYFFENEGWISYKDCQQDFYYQRFIFNRKMLADNNLFFPPYRRYQDPPFFVKAMVLAEKFYAVSKPVYAYRARITQMVWSPEKVYDRLAGLADELTISRDAKLSLLHARIVARLEGIYNSIHRETTLGDDMLTKEAFQKIYESIDPNLINESGIVSNLGFLEQYLDMTNVAQERSRNAMPKVSVIVPVYNVESYLNECLDSILNQTLRDIEIICVNDGSTDSSLRVLEEYRRKDARVKVISQWNGGLSCARNTGLRAARGEYVYFIDSDDYIETNALEYLYQEARKDQLDILFFDGESFFEPPELKKEFPGDDCCYRPCEFYGVLSGVEMYEKMREKGVFRPMVWLQLLRRQYLLDEKLTFREGILHEDILFTTCGTLQAKRVGHRNIALYHYRRRANAITSSQITFDRVYGKYVSLMTLLQYMENHDFGVKVNLYMARYLKWLYEDIVGNVKSLSTSEKNKIRKLLPTEQVRCNITFSGKLHINDPVFPENETAYKPKIIVSLTSYPARIQYVATAIRSLMQQTMQADMILLWLSKDQFPNQEKDLPQELLDLTAQGLTIRWCAQNLMSHKKYFYTMQEYPDDIVILADDDLEYYPDTIADLYQGYLKFPRCVSAVRCHLPSFLPNGNIDTYDRWKRCVSLVGIPSMALFSTSGAGTLYPPRCMHPELFNVKMIQECCPYADDIWMKIMQVMNNTPTVLVRPERPLKQIKGSQNEALWYDNVNSGKNDLQMSATVSKYNTYFGPQDTLLRRMRSDMLQQETLNAATQTKTIYAEHTEEKASTNEAFYRMRIAYLESELRGVHASWTYRIGRFITFIPRKVRGGIRCYQEHGLSYTWDRLLVHLHLKDDPYKKR